MLCWGLAYASRAFLQQPHRGKPASASKHTQTDMAAEAETWLSATTETQLSATTEPAVGYLGGEAAEAEVHPKIGRAHV